ncbi:MAG TPA: thermonuclease family protein [Methanotrichaceae archaeon]|nr:thermonuclease family protein [Methanotrichaceae archaeon]
MKKLLVLLLTLIFIQEAVAAPDEAIGRVVSVLSGDAFGIEVQSGDERVQRIDRVKLADVDSPSTLTAEGKAAKKYAASILRNKTVYLDIDDKTPGGRNDVGQLICVVYLEDSNSRPVWPPFNRIIVEEGHAVVNDANNNEFNATAWWQAPPEMKITRQRAMINGEAAVNGEIAVNEEEEIRSEAKILEKDANSSLISIGYRH